MSTLSRYVANSRLTPRALNAALIPVVTLVFLSGLPRIFEPLIVTIWEFWFPSQIPVHLLNISAVFGLLSVGAGFTKWFISETVAQALRVEGEVKTFGPEDLPILAFYLFFGYIGMVWFGIPLTFINVLQAGIMLILSLSFVTIPWYLWTFASVPEKTDDVVTKTMVVVLTFALGFLFTTMALFGMRAVEFCTVWPSQCGLA